MSDTEPRNLMAGDREAGAVCPRCELALEHGDAASICRSCGTVHHRRCWETAGGCGYYECLPAAAKAESSRESLSITRTELDQAEPLPTRDAAESVKSDLPRSSREPRRNRTATAALVVALLGIPLFGLVTGIVAMVLACIALAGHSQGRRGLGVAVAAMVIGLLDVLGWAAGLYVALGPSTAHVALDDLTLDPDSLNELPDRIARAMRANVVIHTGAAWRPRGIGSGVILSIRDGLAQVVTNRHMVDRNYAGGQRSPPADLDSLDPVHLLSVDQMLIPAKVEWIAPHGVDLAIVSARLSSSEVATAPWDRDAAARIGDSVFAVGNPHGLGWTHSAGDISQIRRQTIGDYNFRVLQTTAAINPGNSGGGLYDAEGRLIGINTFVADHRVAEGLGFSIALPTLLELAPQRFQLPPRNVAEPMP